MPEHEKEPSRAVPDWMFTDRYRERPLEYSVNLNFFGTLFRGADWQPTGQRVPSLHPANNGRSIMCWRFVGSRVD
jgi:hypothetical protein